MGVRKWRGRGGLIVAGAAVLYGGLLALGSGIERYGKSPAIAPPQPVIPIPPSCDPANGCVTYWITRTSMFPSKFESCATVSPGCRKCRVFSSFRMNSRFTVSTIPLPQSGPPART